MVRKAFLKSFFLLFKEQLGRFLALTAISAVGIGFIAGLGPLKDKLEYSASSLYAEKAVPDAVLVSSKSDVTGIGFTEDEITLIDNQESSEKTEAFFFNEYENDETEETYTRVYYRDFASSSINALSLKEGNYPSSSNEVLAERGGGDLVEHQVGDIVKVDVLGLSGLEEKELTVCGICENPLFSYAPSLISFHDEADGDHAHLSEVMYLSYEDNQVLNLTQAKNGINIIIDGVDHENVYDEEYQNKVSEKGDEYISLLDDASVSLLTLEDFSGVAALGKYAEKVFNIAVVFSVFFIVVVGLVIATTLSRLIEEERSKIACYRSLGITNGSIAMKYGSFSILSVVIGACLGYFLVGLFLMKAIYGAFNGTFILPSSMVSRSFPLFGLLGALMAILVSFATTVLVLFSSLKETPSALMQPKAPKAGKKILLEKIPFIWKHLSFNRKSATRNIFLHPVRFWMTIITVIGSLCLMIGGSGLLDSCSHYENGESGMIRYIAIIVIILAGVLSVLVLYNLTNISVSEKKREIATLMVLGYKDREVCTYVYREILFVVFLGILLGIPCGMGFASFLFAYVDFGSLSYVGWYTYVLVACGELMYLLLVDLLLRKKITQTDMNGSLKAVE